MALATAVVAVVTQRQGGAMPDLATVSPRVRLGNAALAVPRYLAATLWPRRLSAFYPLSTTPPSTLAVSAALLLVGGVTGLALRWARRGPWLCCGWLWVFALLGPV